MKYTKWLTSLVGVLLLPFTANANPLELGAALPEVTSVDSDGKEVKLKDLGSNGMTLFFFYPKANTGG